MRLGYFDILFQEVPGEISLGSAFSGCPLMCRNCHSSELRDEDFGTEFGVKELNHLLDEYGSMATCVVFLGGDWKPRLLKEFAEVSRGRGLIS